MKEQNIQTLFGKYLREKWTGTAVFELKLEKGTSFRFDRVAPHQVEALLSVQGNGLYHKISDSLPVFGGNKYMRFTSKKPFDCLYINSPAYREQHSRKSARLGEL